MNPNQFIGLEAAKGCTGFSSFVLVDPLSLVDPFVLTYLPVSVGLPLSDGPANAIVWPVINMAQSLRAILFAKATATTIRGRDSSIRANHGSAQRFQRSMELMTDIAPMISNRLTSF